MDWSLSTIVLPQRRVALTEEMLVSNQQLPAAQAQEIRVSRSVQEWVTDVTSALYPLTHKTSVARVLAAEVLVSK